jgi:hypothetical protein
MGKAVTVALCLWAALAAAKPWNGVDPGATKKDEVVKRFGEPSRTVQAEGKEVLAYFGPQAIKGTSQTQFRVDPASQLVERIDVFPGPNIERDVVESTYGPACPSSAINTSGGPCYFKKLTDDFRTYFLYPRLGLAVFFNEDGKTVQSFIFQPPKGSSPAKRD